MLKICPICKINFEGRKDRVVCGKECNRKWRSIVQTGKAHVKLNKMSVMCPVCNRLFILRRKEVVTCSAKCGHKLQAQKVSGENSVVYNKHLKNRNCLFCGKVFRPNSGQVGKYCSKNCCDLDKIVSKSRVVCEECGITFEKDRWKVDFTTKMFCSRKCYAKNFNRRSPKVDLMVCWLKELGLKVEEEKSFPWLKNPNGYNLYLDVFVPDKLLAIEYDGRHHYKPTFEKDNSAIVLYRQTLDKLKDKLCSKYCITLIRFRYDEPFDKKHFLNKLEFVV